MKKALILGLLIAVVLTSCEKSDDDGQSTDPQKIGLVGEWYSSGDNVAVLLTTYFGVDSVYAKFETNNTYLVESFANGAKTTYTGTFIQASANMGTIWNLNFYIENFKTK